jgi:hypothetical protein
MVAREAHNEVCIGCGSVTALCRIEIDDCRICRSCVEAMLHYALAGGDAVRACIWRAKHYPNLRGARIARDEDGAKIRIDLARAYCEMGLIGDAVSEALLAALGAETTRSVEHALDTLFSDALAYPESHSVLARMAARARVQTG